MYPPIPRYQNSQHRTVATSIVHSSPNSITATHYIIISPTHSYQGFNTFITILLAPLLKLTIKFSHTTPLLFSNLSSGYSLVTAQPVNSITCNLISVLSPGRTRSSSSLITITRPPSSSSLRITDRSFRYASPSLWNNLPASFRQLRSSSVTTITPSITSLSLFHSRLKTHLFHKSFPP